MSVGLGDIPANLDPALRDLLERLVEGVGRLQGSVGDGTGRAVTAGELIGGTTTGGGALPGGGGGGSTEPDLTPPPTPTGLSASAGVTRVIVEVDPALYTQGHGHDRTVIYGATWTSGPLPVFADAVPLGDFLGTVGQFPSEPATTWRVWVKWRSVDGVEGSPAGGTNGVEAITGTINNQQIGTAVIDDAKVANLSAAKLTAGDGTIGGNLKSSNFVGGVSGWIVQPNGYAEFSNVVIRGASYTGTIFANAGTIGGVTIGLADMRTTNYVPATSGWRLNADGSAEFAAVSIYGQLQAYQIGSNQVTTDKLPAAAVTTAKVAVENINAPRFASASSPQTVSGTGWTTLLTTASFQADADGSVLLMASLDLDFGSDYSWGGLGGPSASFRVLRVGSVSGTVQAASWTVRGPTETSGPYYQGRVTAPQFLDDPATETVYYQVQAACPHVSLSFTANLRTLVAMGANR